MKIIKQTVTAKSRRLTTRNARRPCGLSMRKRRKEMITRNRPIIWRCEPIQDIIACHHPDLEQQLYDAFVTEIQRELLNERGMPTDDNEVKRVRLLSENPWDADIIDRLTELNRMIQGNDEELAPLDANEPVSATERETMRELGIPDELL